MRLVAIIVIILSMSFIACIPEADKNEVVPGFKGRATRLDAGKVRFHYDFSSADQLQDWIAEGEAQVEVKDGKMWVHKGDPGVVRFKPELRVERLIVKSSCVKFDDSQHINVYLNTRWNGSWEGEWGVGFILRGDYALFCLDGRSKEDVFPLPCKENVTYNQEFKVSPAGAISWSVDGKEWFKTSSAKIAGRSGHVLLGAYNATATFDDIVIEGYIVPATKAPEGQ